MVFASPLTATLTLDKYDADARSWIASTQQRADALRHHTVLPVHLLLTGLDQEFGVEAVFRRAGVDNVELRALTLQELAKLPLGHEPAYLAPEFLSLLRRAEHDADALNRAVQVRDILSALTHCTAGAVASILRAVKIGPGDLSGFMTALKVQKPGLQVTPASDTVPAVSDWVSLSRQDNSQPVIGRERAILRLITVLERRDKCHPVLIGEPGVGKAAVVRGLAHHIAANRVPPRLAQLQLLDVDLGSLNAGSRLRSDAETRLRTLVKTHTNNAVQLPVFVLRDLGRVLGGSPLQANLADVLSSLLARGSLRLLATITPSEWQRVTTDHPVLLEWLSPITIDAPSPDEAVAMLRGSAARFERHHDVTITDAAVHAAVHLAQRYLSQRLLPDSAFDLLDESAAAYRVLLSQQPELTTPGVIPVVDENHVATTVAAWTGIPVAKMLEAETDKLKLMAERLSARVIGQDRAVNALTKAIRRSRVGLRDPRRPIGSFLFLGTSGVGKTELAKALAEFLFDDRNALLRIDMSEFMERHMAQRLVGAPPGYADSEQGGFLTEAVRKRPYSVLLFDEVEKAHADVFNLLLQVLDDGRLTDGRGQTADFTNTVVIMTSNIGADKIVAAEPSVFADPAQVELLMNEVVATLRQFFRPEFLNRIGEIVPFRPLAKPDLLRIVDLQLQQLAALASRRGITLHVTQQAKNELVERGYEPALGARPLQRTIIREIQDPLAETLLAKPHSGGSRIEVGWDGSQFVFS
jgi:ATP-dependent Clp protease ATP-binding subunit ClpC